MLVVEFEEGVLVLAHMKENLLVGVLGVPRGVEGGDGEGEGKGKGGEAGEEGGDGGDGGEGEEVNGGVGDEGGEGAEGASGGEGETAWKGAEAQAEAMAAYLRVEMREFSMPRGFE